MHTFLSFVFFALVALLVLLLYVSITGHAPTLRRRPRPEELSLLKDIRRQRETLATLNGYVQRALAANPHPQHLEQDLHEFAILFNQLKERLDEAEQQVELRKLEGARRLLNDDIMPLVDIEFRIPGRGISPHSFLMELDRRSGRIRAKA